MNQSFYIGALGAMNQQTKLNIVSNNIANVNTVGFKPQNGVFSDLVYEKVRNAKGENGAMSGSGTRIETVKSNMSTMPYTETG